MVEKSDGATPYLPRCRQTVFVVMYLVGSAVLALLAFEILYRIQVVDTYAPELRAYDPGSDLRNDDGRPTILLMGDSFTAGTESFPAILRRDLPGARIINAGIPGTGIIETAIVAAERFRRFRPAVFVYQIYVGNDLFNITYPVNWHKLSVTRNLYWMLAQRFRSISYLNYRLGQFNYRMHVADDETISAPAVEQPFAPEV